MEILVRIQNQYGWQMVYPICEKAKCFAAIAGTKTLTPEAQRRIKQLGYKITVEVPQL